MTLHDGITRMRKIVLKCLFILTAVAAAATSCTGAPEFELIGKEMFEGPPRDAGFFQWEPGMDGARGWIIAGGGAVMVIPQGTPLDEGVVIQLDGAPLDIVTVAQNAWIATEDIGLVGIDLSDLTAPVTWTAHVIEDINSCVTAGRYIIACGSKSGLYLFDAKGVPPGGSPRLLFRIDDMVPGTRLISSGPHIYTAVLSGGEVILFSRDTDKKALVERSRIEAPGEIVRSGISKWTLHLLSRNGEVFRYDLENPHEPVRLPSLPEKNVSDIYIRYPGGLALLESGQIVPFSTEWSQDPRYSLMRAEGMTRSPGFPGRSIRAGRHGFVTFGPESGFNFYENDGDYIRARGNIPARGFAIDLTVNGEYIYLANGRDGLRIGRIDGEGSIGWTGHVQTDEARDAAIDGNILVLADGSGGVRFYDVTVPDSPALLSTWESSSYLSAVCASSGTAYLAGGLRGIEVVDFTDPANPSLLWNERLSEVRGLDIDKNHLYVADGFDGLRIYSLSGDVPGLISTMDTPGWVSDLFVSGDILYIADGQRGFMAADISDRSAPVRMGRIELGAIARTIHVRGDVAFIATQTLGITAVDVSDPRRPAIAARYQTVDDARGAFADERFVYLASGYGGLYIFRYKK
jgi:hypothetical protein